MAVKYPFAKELKALDVLTLKDAFLKTWRLRLQSTMIKIRRDTVQWAVEYLSTDNAPASILSFTLPAKAMILHDFRALYIQAYQLGADNGNRMPPGGVWIKADIAAAVFTLRVETTLKDDWRRLSTTNKRVITRVTNKAFEHVIH